MQVLEFLILFISLIFSYVALRLGYENRDSEKVRKILLPGLAVSIVTALIAIQGYLRTGIHQADFMVWAFDTGLPTLAILSTGAVVTILLSLEVEKKAIEFPAVLIIEKASKTLLRI